MLMVCPPTVTTVVVPEDAAVDASACAAVSCCPGEIGEAPAVCAVCASIPDPVISCGRMLGPCNGTVECL